jgi:hypothetical protein
MVLKIGIKMGKTGVAGFIKTACKLSIGSRARPQGRLICRRTINVEKKMGILDAIKKPKNDDTNKTDTLGGSKPNVLSRAEVEAIIEARAREKNMQHARWQVSIVDLMAVLGMNSSQDARRVLAAKLNYSGRDADGSAEKNMWIHAELLKALAQNGGRVPSNLL